MAIVATLMAGAVDPKSYGLDENGSVFVLDAEGKPLEPPVSEPIAARVREAVERGTSAATIYYMWPTRNGNAWIVAARFEGTQMDVALEKIKAAGIPKPVPVGAPPSGWESVSDKNTR